MALGAPWCTLCFADLRPAPAPAAAAPAPAPAAAAAPAPAAAAPVSAPAGTTMLAPHPILDAPPAPRHAAEEPPAAAAPGWPCTVCGESVPLDLTACPACGAGFLAAARTQVSLVVPGLGDVAKLSKGTRLALMGGGATVVTGLVFLVLVVLGHLV